MNNESIPEMQARADKCETDGDVKGWIRAMRKLATFDGWREDCPASVPVTQRFYDIIRANMQDGRIGWDIGVGSGREVFFRGVVIHPEVLCDA